MGAASFTESRGRDDSVRERNMGIPTIGSVGTVAQISGEEKQLGKEMLRPCDSSIPPTPHPPVAGTQGRAKFNHSTTRTSSAAQLG